MKVEIKVFDGEEARQAEKLGIDTETLSSEWTEANMSFHQLIYYLEDERDGDKVLECCFSGDTVVIVRNNGDVQERIDWLLEQEFPDKLQNRPGAK